MSIPCVGAIVFDDEGRLLVVQRRNPPNRGTWSLPGGRVWSGEALPDAVLRELKEETNLVGRVVRVVGEVQFESELGTLHITDFLCTVDDARAAEAGDDALDLRWVGRRELGELPTSPGLIATLADWGVLPTFA